MEVIHLMLADSANISREGKLNVLGIFNTIRANQFPAMHPQMYVVVELLASPSEYDTERELTVKILDSDAQNKVVDWHRTINVSRPPQGGDASIKQILELRGIVFPKPDTYQVSLLVDNDEKETIKLFLREVDKN